MSDGRIVFPLLVFVLALFDGAFAARAGFFRHTGEVRPTENKEIAWKLPISIAKAIE